jgi:histidine triad (HIT) family protein
VGRLDVDPIGSKYPIAAEGFFPPEATPKDTIGDLMASACIFCAIVAGSEPSRQVMESERTLAFLDINPAADGHTLVAPKAHATDIWTLTEDVASDVWRLTVAVARRLNDVLHPDGMTLFKRTGRPGGRTSFTSISTSSPAGEGIHLSDLGGPLLAIPSTSTRLQPGYSTPRRVRRQAELAGRRGERLPASVTFS